LYKERRFLKKQSWLKIGIRNPQIFKVNQTLIDDFNPSGREIMYLYGRNANKEGCLILFENYDSFA
jgi:hypothetical protein